MDDRTPEVEKKPVGLDPLAHRKLIGWLGVLLPLMVVLISRLFPIPGAPWKMLDSISDFYYTSAASVFVGCLFALAMFLFTYGGYAGDYADRFLGRIAGCAALGVAFFPKEPLPPFTAPPWRSEWMGTAHYASAIVLFLSFIAFALWIFRRSSAKQRIAMPADKLRRNRVFLACGLVMIVSVSWTAIALIREKPIFWSEAIALVAFSVSWLVKGGAHESAVALLHKVRGFVKRKT